jgi:hypothetical protein
MIMASFTVTVNVTENAGLFQELPHNCAAHYLLSEVFLMYA